MNCTNLLKHRNVGALSIVLITSLVSASAYSLDNGDGKIEQLVNSASSVKVALIPERMSFYSMPDEQTFLQVGCNATFGGNDVGKTFNEILSKAGLKQSMPSTAALNPRSAIFFTLRDGTKLNIFFNGREKNVAKLAGYYAYYLSKPVTISADSSVINGLIDLINYKSIQLDVNNSNVADCQKYLSAE